MRVFVALLLVTQAACRAEPPSEPFALWLQGSVAGRPWPPAWLVEAAAAAGGAGQTAPLGPPSLRRPQEALDVVLRWARPRPDQPVCAPVLAQLDAHLRASGFSPRTAANGTEYGSDASGVARRVLVSCVPAVNEPVPGCTGGSCAHPTTLVVDFTKSIPAPRFRTVAEALAPYPALGAPIRARVLPGFLEQRADAAGLESLACERWQPDACPDLQLRVHQRGARPWIEATVALAHQHGFGDGHDEPGRYPVTTYQECADVMLYLTGEDEEGTVLLMLTKYGSAPAPGNPVTCSAR